MIIHLAAAFDQNYLVPFYALAESVLQNNLQEKFVFHCITTGVEESERQKIIDYLQLRECQVYFYDIDEYKSTLDKLTNTTRNVWTLATYYKMFFPFLVPKNVTKLLYLDIDIVVLRNLREVYETDLATYPLAAVPDLYVDTRETLGIINSDDYFNAGLLLMNIPVWKEQKVTEKAISFMNENPEKIKFVDQDALNFILKNNWKKMPQKYNVVSLHIPFELSKKHLKSFISDTVILHFTGVKPWQFLCTNRYRYLYEYYLKKSPMQRAKIITDFSFPKIYPYLKFRFVEFYLDRPLVHRLWKVIRSFRNKFFQLFSKTSPT